MFDEAFREYLEEAIGRSNAAVAFSALERQVSVSARVNPLKFPALLTASESVTDVVAGHFGCPVMRVPWSEYGYVLESRPEFTLDPLFHAGAYYVQDSSAMFVGEAFRKVVESIYGGSGHPTGADGGSGGPLKVLDLCAAPGGKATDLAASLRKICGDNFILVANEVMRDRVNVLSENLARWGDPNVVVTCADPVCFASLEGFFDVIVADVPCSGEGMFRKDASAREQWSKDNVSLCESRQRRIIGDVFPALADNGYLIYSTCTFNKYENDGNAKWICDDLGCEIGTVLVANKYDGVLETECGAVLIPGFVSGEGQYCSVLRKRASLTGGNAARKEDNKSSRNNAQNAHTKINAKRYFNRSVKIMNHNQTLVAVPGNIADEVAKVSSAVRAVRLGCTLGEMKGDDFVPSCDLALNILLMQDAFDSADVDLQTALAYLHRDTIFLKDSPKGYLIVTYKGLPLGFVKNLGSRCNNLYPQARRIRMDVKI